jgi:seryl-tRNA synthetase
MAKTANFYIDRANAKFEAGFTTLSARKEALSDLNRAHDVLTEQIKKLVLDIPHAERTDAQNVVYWDALTDLHNWKPKHSKMVNDVFPEAEAITLQIEDLAALRLTIKNAEVVRVERATSEKAEKVYVAIRDIMEKRKAQYARGLDLHDLFNGLPVHANVHYVVNQFGTRFIRAFYYMYGELTPLNIICAVLDAKDPKKQ